MRGPDSVQVSLDLKVLKVSGTWSPNDEERRAAWELYVELVTRIGAVPLVDGLSREALSSLYSIFGATREIMRRYGPIIAESKPSTELNFGLLAVGMLNGILRPTLAYWHPILLEWEDGRPSDIGRLQHERQWPRDLEFREQLAITGVELRAFVKVLAIVCNVPDLSRSYAPGVGS